MYQIYRPWVKVERQDVANEFMNRSLPRKAGELLGQTDNDQFFTNNYTSWM
jgi:hypothetical protein